MEVQEVDLIKAENRRERVVRLVRRFGGATTDAILDPTTLLFEHPSIEGFIGYLHKDHCLLVFGDPVCAPWEREELALHFHQFAREQNLSVITIAASEEYAKRAVNKTSEVIMEFGQEIELNPFSDPRKNTGTHGSLVRRKTKQALREGVLVHEYIPHNPLIEKGIEKAKEEWLASKKGLNLHISDPYLFKDSLGKRWFYANKNEEIIGIVVLNRLEAKKGWLINHLMVLPHAPHGVSELLITEVLETLKKEDCSYATTGIVASLRLGEIQGFSKMRAFLFRLFYRTAAKLLHLDRLSTFWGKFQPKTSPLYLMFSHQDISLRDLITIKEALKRNIKGGKSERI